MSLTRETVKTTLHAQIQCSFAEFNPAHADHASLIEAKDQEGLALRTPAGWHIEKQWETFEPATVISHGANGHKYAYRIIGFYLDGTVRTSSWDAQHQDDCRCHTSEDW